MCNGAEQLEAYAMVGQISVTPYRQRLDPFVFDFAVEDAHM